MAGEALAGAEATALGPAALAALVPFVLWEMHRMAPEMAARRHAAEAEQLRHAGELPRNVDPGAFNYPPTPPTPAVPVDPRQSALPGFPSKPPLDPKDERKNKKPIEPIVVHGTEFPITTDNEAHIFIFPDLSDKIDQILVLENRKGNPATQKQVRDEITIRTDADPSLTHIGGGSLSETWIPGPGHAFKDEKGRYGDGRPGGKFLDAALLTKSGKLIGLQIADVDRNGKPTQRELDNARAIALQKYNGNPIDVIIIPKKAQMERLKHN